MFFQYSNNIYSVFRAYLCYRDLKKKTLAANSRAIFCSLDHVIYPQILYTFLTAGRQSCQIVYLIVLSFSTHHQCISEILDHHQCIISNVSCSLVHDPVFSPGQRTTNRELPWRKL